MADPCNNLQPFAKDYLVTKGPLRSIPLGAIGSQVLRFLMNSTQSSYLKAFCKIRKYVGSLSPPRILCKEHLGSKDASRRTTLEPTSTQALNFLTNSTEGIPQSMCEN